MKLRPYQQRAYEATLASLRRGKNPVVAIPTGGGKSLLISALVDRFRGRGGYTLVVTHSKELITQNVNTLGQYKGLDGIGVYSAGLGEAEVGEHATYGTIQTLYRNLGKLPTDVDAIIVDEAHWVAHKGNDAKMYNALMAKYPEARKIGMSATPYRLTSGLIYDGEGAHFDDLAVEISILELVQEGYLCPLVGLSVREELDLSGVHKTAGEYNTGEVDDRITETWLEQVLSKVGTLASDRNTILLFAPTVRVAKLAAEIATRLGISAEYVHGGDTEREDRLKRWEAGEFRLMSNVGILTTGYDNPKIDCIIDCSPTESIGKHVQKLGRGVRISPGKENCLVLDAVGNLLRLGGVVVGLRDMRKEESSGEIVRIPATPRERVARSTKTASELSDLDPMLASPKGVWVNVEDVRYIVIGSKAQPGKSLLMVQYDGKTEGGVELSASEFVCVEYSGYAREKAVAWFYRRGDIVTPWSAEAARTRAFGLPSPRRVRVRKRGKYMNIVGEEF